MAPRRKLQGARKRLTLTLDASEFALLGHYAEANGIDRSDAVRAAVRYFLAVEADLEPANLDQAPPGDPLRKLIEDPVLAMRRARRLLDLALGDRVEPQLDLFQPELLAASATKPETDSS